VICPTASLYYERATWAIAMTRQEPPLKRYELVQRIAVGGMAEVFLAKSYGLHDFEKVLAIKRILPNLASDPKFERRFVAEAKIAVTLTHANIVQILDFSRFGESLYIAMEYVDGADLATVLKASGELGEPVPIGAALHIAIEFLSGLDFAHSRSVVHRDVSPSNILLSRAGEVKVADFGIAQAAHLDHTQTRSFKIVGKWRYMSPEQTRGEVLDARSDLFSAGVVLFELLTGQKLFPGSEPEDIVREIRSAAMPRASVLRRDLPEAVDDVLASALQREPRARTSAGELRDALVSLSYSQSVPATPMQLARYLAKLDLRDPAAGRRTPSSGPRGILEEILREELRSDDPSRITPEAVGPPAFHPEDGELEREDIEHDEVTNTSISIIRSMPGPDGLTQWVLGDETDLHEIGVDTEVKPPPGPYDDHTAATRVLSLDRQPAPAPADTPADAGLARAPSAPSRARSQAAHAPTRTRVPAAASPRSAAPAIADIESAPAGASIRRLPRRLWPMVALGAVAVAVAAAVVWTLSRGDSEAESQPEDTASAAPSSFDAGTASAIRIDSEPPGAEVLFAGEVIGTTPMHREMPPGRYAFTLRRAGYEPCAKEQQVALGRSANVFCNLEAELGTLSVQSSPGGAEVWVSGQLLGTTPLSQPMPAGMHEVELRLRGRESVRSMVSIPAGEVASLEEEFQATEPRPTAGTIDIFTEPWADIYLGGKKVGVAPMQDLKLPRGKHRLRLVNPVQGRERTITVTVPARRPYRVVLPAAAAP